MREGIKGVSILAKAAILEKPGEGLIIGEIELADPAPHEVLIDTKACGLCHSDLHFIDGAYPHPLPAIPGHEAAGVVRAVGSEVKTVKNLNKKTCDRTGGPSGRGEAGNSRPRASTLRVR